MQKIMNALKAQPFHWYVTQHPKKSPAKLGAVELAADYVRAGSQAEAKFCLDLRTEKKGFLAGMFHHSTKTQIKKAFKLNQPEVKDDSPKKALLMQIYKRRREITLSGEKYRAADKIAKIKVLNECENLLNGTIWLAEFKVYLEYHSGYKGAFHKSKTAKLVEDVIALVEPDHAPLLIMANGL